MNENIKSIAYGNGVYMAAAGDKILGGRKAIGLCFLCRQNIFRRAAMGAALFFASFSLMPQYADRCRSSSQKMSWTVR